MIHLRQNPLTDLVKTTLRLPASFIGEPMRPNTTEISREELTKLGWNIYTLQEKNVKMKSHLDFLKTCLEEELIPAGLTINKTSAAGEDDKIFRDK